MHPAPYAQLLHPIARELGPLRMMEAAERELRVDLQPLVDEALLEILPHEGWLTTPEQFAASATRSKGEVVGWRMDRFYQRVRRDTGVLMEGGKPVGGRFSFDGDNREAWSGEPPAPANPRFPRDPVKDEVLALVAEHYGRHPGSLDGDALPATRADAEALWAWARSACMPSFGPYEDAMSVHSRNLFHTRISPLLNLHRLTPRHILDDVLALDIPLNSLEGFVRQVLGWREFVHHVHRATDGFRQLPSGSVPEAPTGAAPSVLGAERPLPPAFWEGAPSGLHCLDTVVESVWEEGYSPHITRLMVLANLATLLDVSPRALTDWFWVAYVDAYDWVVEPNVLGMGTFGAGEVMTTKPYVSGARYIDKMSDYCGACAFDPKKTCPVTRLYWAFLARHQDVLRGNRRMGLIMGSLRKRKDADRARDAATFDAVWERLAAGAPVLTEDLP